LYWWYTIMGISWGYNGDIMGIWLIWRIHWEFKPFWDTFGSILSLSPGPKPLTIWSFQFIHMGVLAGSSHDLWYGFRAMDLNLAWYRGTPEKGTVNHGQCF
jgi:hypothetical protein